MRRIASGAALLYLATLLAAPLVDRALDPLRSYPEDYSSGAAGAIVRLGYASGAIMALAIAATLAREPGVARRLAALMLVTAAASSFALAIAPQQVTGGPILVGVVLGLVLAPLVLSFSGRGERPASVVALGFAVSLGFAALAIVPRDIAGITNRVWDVLLALWGVAYPLARARHIESGALTPISRSV